MPNPGTSVNRDPRNLTQEASEMEWKMGPVGRLMTRNFRTLINAHSAGVYDSSSRSPAYMTGSTRMRQGRPRPTQGSCDVSISPPQANFMAASTTLPDPTKSLGAVDVEDGSGGAGGGKKASSRWPGFVHFLFVLSVVMCALVYVPRFLAPALTSGAGVDFFEPRPSPLGRAARGQGQGVAGKMVDPVVVLDNQVNSPCASMPSRHGICCDRSDFNTDVCFMAGDVRTDAASLSFLLYPPAHAAHNATAYEKEERIRPYTRKWERHLMSGIHEVCLRAARPDEAASDQHRCDVVHDAPALVMTAGGYTGNLFHAFNDAFLPAWLTVQHLRRRVVFVVLAYNPWWAGTFRELVSGLSDHHVIDLLHDKRTHCFPAGAIVGTRFHGTLAADPARTREPGQQNPRGLPQLPCRRLQGRHLAGAHDAAATEAGTASEAGHLLAEGHAGDRERSRRGAACGVGRIRRVHPRDGERVAAAVGVRGGERCGRAGGRARRGPDQAPLPPPGPRGAPPGGPAGRAADRARVLRGGVRHDERPLRAVRRGGERELAPPAVRGRRRGGGRPGEGEAREGVGPREAGVPQRPEREPRSGQVRGDAAEVALPRPAAAGSAA